MEVKTKDDQFIHRIRFLLMLLYKVTAEHTSPCGHFA